MSVVTHPAHHARETYSTGPHISKCKNMRNRCVGSEIIIRPSVWVWSLTLPITRERLILQGHISQNANTWDIHAFRCICSGLIIRPSVVRSCILLVMWERMHSTRNVSETYSTGWQFYRCEQMRHKWIGWGRFVRRSAWVRSLTLLIVWERFVLLGCMSIYANKWDIGANKWDTDAI